MKRFAATPQHVFSNDAVETNFGGVDALGRKTPGFVKESWKRSERRGRRDLPASYEHGSLLV
jgi:hypothetical protein